ncbi:uncharacterized protein LOC117340420 [Pecten maximus]|uniref:uncharacterized protein LOC117340420 n=1 Tax=Pecten maximus TaxID=6579 RepID=UPI001458E130|nr:uncharacterized protein LOC117340420 [Pecten maximus]
MEKDGKMPGLPTIPATLDKFVHGAVNSFDPAVPGIADQEDNEEEHWLKYKQQTWEPYHGCRSIPNSMSVVDKQATDSAVYSLEDMLKSATLESTVPTFQTKSDVARFTSAVKGNGTDLQAFKAVFQIKHLDVEHFPLNPLLIVAVFGSHEAIEYVHKWRSTAFNWNERIRIESGVLDGVLDEMTDTQATPLYIATFMRRLPTVKSLIKYADEGNLVYCMNNLPLSYSMESVYMTEVGERLKMEYSQLKPAVVPGYKKDMNDSWGKVYVVYSPDIIHSKDLEREGIGLVMLRNPYMVDREAVSVSQNKDAGYGISKQEMGRGRQAIESHSKTLWCNHSNLNIISVSPVRSKRKGAELEQCLCIVLYCSTKGVVPIGENEFPRKLDIAENESISIDVREGYFVFGGYNTGPGTCYHDKLKMGCNIGEVTTQVQNGGGTLGPFVQYDGRLSFLTCAHVLFDVNVSKHVDFTENGNHRVDVVQPAIGSSRPSGTPCGFVQRAIFDARTAKDISIDVAVVEISDINTTTKQWEIC